MRSRQRSTARIRSGCCSSTREDTGPWTSIITTACSTRTWCVSRTRPIIWTRSSPRRSEGEGPQEIRLPVRLSAVYDRVHDPVELEEDREGRIVPAGDRRLANGGVPLLRLPEFGLHLVHGGPGPRPRDRGLLDLHLPVDHDRLRTRAPRESAADQQCQ